MFGVFDINVSYVLLFSDHVRHGLYPFLAEKKCPWKRNAIDTFKDFYSPMIFFPITTNLFSNMERDNEGQQKPSEKRRLPFPVLSPVIKNN